MEITTSQTIGPFSHEAWRWACDATATVATSAPTVTITGFIRDGDGVPIDDAMIEAWLPASAGAETGQAIPGFRRVASADDGSFSFILTRPAGAQPGEPAALVTVFARGLVKHQFTAVFLDDDPGIDASAILRQVPAGRRATLIARSAGNRAYRWDIAMQGARETAFFDYV